MICEVRHRGVGRLQGDKGPGYHCVDRTGRVDVDGLVTLLNTGVIRSLNALPGKGESVAYSEGVSVGGGVFRMPIENLVNGSRLYVATALDLCNQERRAAV